MLGFFSEPGVSKDLKDTPESFSLFSFSLEVDFYDEWSRQYHQLIVLYLQHELILCPVPF